MAHQHTEHPVAQHEATAAEHPYRIVFLVAESLIALGGAAGAVQLAEGTYAPPVSDLEPLGLTSWVLPGVWLLVMVAVPSATAAWLAWRRSPRTPVAVLVASALLIVEVTVQIPFVGPSVLQAVFGGAGLVLGGLALRARRIGWTSRPQECPECHAVTTKAEAYCSVCGYDIVRNSAAGIGPRAAS